MDVDNRLVFENSIRYKDVESILGVSQPTVLNLVSRGNLKQGVDLGKEKTVTRESLEEFKNSSEYKLLQSRQAKIKTAKQQHSEDIARIETKVDTLQKQLQEQSKILTELLEQNKLLMQLLQKKQQALYTTTQHESPTKVTTNKNEAQKKPRSAKPRTKRERMPVEKVEEIKSYIRNAVDGGIFKKDIEPPSKGGNLGLWLDGKKGASDKKILWWYENTKRLINQGN